LGLVFLAINVPYCALILFSLYPLYDSTCPYFFSHSPCRGLNFFRTYPAMLLDYPALRLLLTLIFVFRTYPAVLLSRFMITTYPAVPLFYFHLPCCALNFFSYLPCCALNFFFTLTLLCSYPLYNSTYSAVAFFFRTHPAVALYFFFGLTLLCPFLFWLRIFAHPPLVHCTPPCRWTYNPQMLYTLLQSQ